jgi:apolipoprotein N-acyltransferase
LLALGSGLLQVLIFPSPSVSALSWIALAPLLLAILQPRPAVGAALDSTGSNLTATPGQGFLLGYISGIVWYGGTCYWVYHTMRLYGGLDAPVAAGVLLLFCLFYGLYHGVFGWLLALAARPKPHGVGMALLLTPFLWVAVELVRSRIIKGFSWDLLGTAQVDNIPLTRLATVTGVYGVSFLIALVNAGIVATYLAPAPRRRRLLPIAFAVAVMLQLGVLARPRSVPADRHAVLVQSNVSLDELWTLDSATQSYVVAGLGNQTLSELKSLSTMPNGIRLRKVDLIVWPESPAPFFDSDDRFRLALSSLAQERQAFVVAGVVGNVPGVTSATPQITNRAIVASPSGEWIGHYDKIHLVPFGEYVPYPFIFGMAQKLTREVGDFRPGVERTVFHAGDQQLGVFICYESIFPDEVRQFAAHGADVLVNISNDGWYGEHGAPGQHLNMARMRAIENNRWLLRDTNSGITASIDPYGRIVAQAPRNQRTSLLAPYGTISAQTFYTRHGDWFATACAIISLAFLIILRRRMTIVRRPEGN